MTSISASPDGVRIYAGPADRAMVLRLGWPEVAALVEERGSVMPENQQPPPLSIVTSARALSRRETQVASGVALSLSSKEIAQRLGLRVRTVTSHLNVIYRKLGIPNRAMLAQWARERGLKLETPPHV